SSPFVHDESIPAATLFLSHPHPTLACFTTPGLFGGFILKYRVQNGHKRTIDSQSYRENYAPFKP
ncbi:hypothetical protein, partial [uncultured Mobiluncus sp.]|uniref:hypothetical protein n=1 Tax=uncultured Mobiluncus sp. TaxID=293425 RepID=UPI0025D977AB